MKKELKKKEKIKKKSRYSKKFMIILILFALIILGFIIFPIIKKSCVNEKTGELKSIGFGSESGRYIFGFLTVVVVFFLAYFLTIIIIQWMGSR